MFGYKRYSLISRIIITLTAVFTVTLLPADAQEVQASRKVSSYKITYELNGGKNNKNNIKNLRKGRSLTLRNPRKKGYTFKGWYEQGKKITKIKGNKRHTLTAKWRKKGVVRRKMPETTLPVDDMFIPKVENASGPLTAPKKEMPDKNGSRNIYPL